MNAYATGKFGAQTSRLSRLGSALSQLANVLVCNGNPNETISSRAYRQGVLGGNRKWNAYRKFVDALFFWQRDHCRVSHESDVEFAVELLKKEREARA